MAREIHLDGGDITVLKSIGLSGAPMFGALLLARSKELGEAELLETLLGLIDQGYVVSNKVNLRTIDEAKRAFFRVNSSYARDLREAIRPNRRPVDERRRRRSG